MAPGSRAEEAKNTHRGLVRRPSCSDVRCDDGVRLDTGTDCDNCANVLHSRRAWRARIAAEVNQELPGLETDARYREIEARMRRHAEAEAADFVARQAEARERAAQRAAARAEAEARAGDERERAAAEAAARQAVACHACGRERSAGLCEACDHRRQTDVLIGQAGLLAATWSAARPTPPPPRPSRPRSVQLSRTPSPQSGPGDHPRTRGEHKRGNRCGGRGRGPSAHVRGWSRAPHPACPGG
ncbi:hypothetical protein [Streptomyces sp. NPDC023327]|uniref:hypothetical protein n=1 Tax=Streptomyces sp. NPDC023327 TaxID=3157088 RepID=UPI00340B3566